MCVFVCLFLPVLNICMPCQCVPYYLVLKFMFIDYKRLNDTLAYFLLHFLQFFLLRNQKYFISPQGGLVFVTGASVQEI